MPLIDCFKNFKPADRDNILRRAEALKKEGMDEVQAVQMSVREYNDDVINELESIFSQVGLAPEKVIAVTPRKKKIAIVDEEIDNTLDELNKLLNPGIGAVSDPQKEAERMFQIDQAAVKLVGLYIKKGVLKFADMMEQVYLKYGEAGVRNFMRAMKKNYADFIVNSDTEGLDDIATVKALKEDELIKSFKDENANREDADSGSRGTDRGDSGDNAGRPQGGSKQGKAPGGQKTDGDPGRVVPGQEQVDDKRGDVGTRGPRYSDTGNTRPESVDADIQQNFRYPEDWERNKNKTFSKRQAYADNIAALTVINELLDNPTLFATEAQKQILSRYNGLGPLGEILLPPENRSVWNKTNMEYYDDAQAVRGLLLDIGKKTGTKPMDALKALETARSSTRNAYYTSLPVIRAIWDGLKAGGFNGGRVLEGSVGSGRFIGGMPASVMNNSKIKGVDMDVVSSLVSKYLYPKASITNSPIQQASLPSNTYDLFISNIPFGQAKVYDPTIDKKGPKWKESQQKLHTYFFAKAIDTVRPGGYIAIVTTANVLDTPSNQATRDLINQETEFVGAVRLPESTFKSDAGTEVITDIILLRKRQAPVTQWESQIDEIATEVVPHDNPRHPDQNIKYNQYFKNNPQNLFGSEFRAGGMYSSDSGYTIKGEADIDKVAERLSEMASKMPIEAKPADVGETTESLQISPSGRMVSGGVVRQDGKYYRVIDFENGKANLEEIKSSVMPSQADMPILNEFIDLKNSYFDVLAKDQLGEDATESRKKLKKQVEKFIKTIKPSTMANLGNSNKAVSRLISQDQDFHAIVALQNEDGKLADIVEKPLPKELYELEKTDSSADAIAYSINKFGKINLPFIQKVLGDKTEEEAMAILEPEVFETLDGDIIDKNTYLSGNVREKLAQAKEWAQVSDKYKKNVDALTKVIPADIPAEDIKFQVGASWVPLQTTQLFLDTIFGKGNMTVRYTKATDNYDVSSNVLGGEYEAVGEEGHRRDADVVVKAALSKNIPDMFYTDREGNRVPLPKLTQDVRDKAERLQSEYEGLVMADEKIRKDLTDLYNEKFNGIVQKINDGSKLTFPGMQVYNLNDHQKHAIMMLVQNMGGMVDHIVGAGKSLVMSVGAIKLKQLGLVKKPMITTMKSVLPGLLKEAKRAYPGAKILAPKEQDFTGNNRQRLFAQIANNDWDLIIITHENLGKIPLPQDFQEEYINEEKSNLLAAIDEINGSSEGKNDRYAVKQAKAIQDRLDKLNAKLHEIQDKGKHASKTDFGVMGIDMLFVDESQQFKNLSFITKLRNVAGLGTQKGSNRAENLKMVSRYLQKMHGGDKGIVFASGTPISNSLVELYNIFQYLRPSLLKKLGMVSLDQFLKNFAEISTLMEKNVAGVIKNRTRLSKFVNVPELASFYSEISDIRGVHNLKLPRPEVRGGKGEIVLTKQSPTVKRITDAIYEASSKRSIGPLKNIGIYPKGDAEKAIGLVLTTLGKKASIDPRLVYPGSAMDGGKIIDLTDTVSKTYKDTESIKGVQLIFADMGTPKKKGAKLGELVEDQMVEMYGEEFLKEFSQAESVWKLTDPAAMKAKLMDVFEISEEEATAVIAEAMNLNSFNVYDEIKKQLIEKGVKESEIAYVHDAPTKKLKEELFKKVQNGDVRVFIGSTQKMGTGVNVQDRVTDMHHLDFGWRPSDMEQRNGRGVRRGNMNKEVGITYYGTEGTIDAYMLEVVSRKQGQIDSFRAGARGIREMDFEDGESMTLAEFAAAVSGDRRLLDLENLKNKVNKLRNRIESAKRANKLKEERTSGAKKEVEFTRSQRELAKDIVAKLRAGVTVQELEEEEEKDGKTKLVKKKVAVFTGEVDGVEYNTAIKGERDRFYQELSDEINSLKSRRSTDRVNVGKIAGVPLYTKGYQGYEAGVPKETHRSIDMGDTMDNAHGPVGIVRSAKVINPGSLKTLINPITEYLDNPLVQTEESYKSALVHYETIKGTQDVKVNEDDLAQLQEVQSKRDKLSDELRKEAEGAPEEKPTEEPPSITDDTSDISKRSGDMHKPFSGATSTLFPLPVFGKQKQQPSDKNLLTYISAKNSAKTLEEELDDQIKIDDNDVEDRMEGAHDPVKANSEKGMWTKAKDVIQGYGRHFRYLSEKLFPRETNLLREFEGLSSWSKGAANIYVKALTEPLTKRQYKILSRKIILEDLLESIKKGLDMTGLDGKYPFGFTSIDSIERAIDKYNEFMAADPAIQKAYDGRQKYMENFKKRLLDAGLLDNKDIENYYHRRVLAYQNDEFAKNILFGKEIGDRKRDFQRRRRGTRGMDYSTNFIETEFKVVSEGLFELEKQAILKDLMHPYENELKALISKFERQFTKEAEELEKQYGPDSLEVQMHDQQKKDRKKKFLTENLPEGYVFYRVNDDNQLFWAKTVSEKVISNALDQVKAGTGAMDVVDELLNSIGTGLMVGAKRKQYMVPAPIAEQLEYMAKDKHTAPLSDLAIAATSEWKKLMLLSPFRFFRYNLNNMGGDLDRTIQVEPEILKYAKQAASELWDYTHYGTLTPQMAEAMRGSVLDSGFEVSELADLTKQQWATHFLNKEGVTLEDIFGKKGLKRLALASINKPGSMYDSYMEWAAKYARLRENVLRYAAYKLAVEKINNGKEFFWASNPKAINSITDSRQKAAKLAREAYGDYGNISYTGQELRRFLMPFYAWLEINMGTTIRLIKNANSPATQRAMVTSAVMRGIPAVAVKMALANMKLLAFTAMVQFWNRYLFEMLGGDDDEATKRLLRVNTKGMQFLVASDPETGIVKALPVAGALYDFLDYFGIPGSIDEVERFMIGGGEGTDILKSVGGQMVNRMSQMVTPFVKSPIELAAGQSYFPDIKNPVPIADRWEYVANMLTLRDEYNYLFTDKPKKESYISRKWNNSFLLREFDPQVLAYYNAKAIVSDYTGQSGGTSDPRDPQDIAKKKAMRYYFMSLRNGNMEDAIKYNIQYYLAGGTVKALRQAVSNADPLKGLKQQEKDDVTLMTLSKDPATYKPLTDFGKSLTKDERLVMKDAMNYFRKTYR